MAPPRKVIDWREGRPSPSSCYHLSIIPVTSVDYRPASDTRRFVPQVKRLAPNGLSRERAAAIRPFMVPLPLASLAALLLLASTLIGCNTRRGLSAADRAAIQALDSAYVSAWLRDDTTAVLATLAPDAVLMPAGVGPLEGHDAIRRFWWPNDGSRTRVTAYRSMVDEIDGSEDLAYVRGTGDMTFVYEKDTVRTEQTSRSMMLTVVARQPDGRWLIRRRMWGAAPK